MCQHCTHLTLPCHTMTIIFINAASLMTTSSLFCRGTPELKRLKYVINYVIILKAALNGFFKDANGVDIPNNKDFGYSE